MRGDRRAALLTVTRTVAGFAGAAVVLVPMAGGAGVPPAVDVAVAWALLTAGVMLAPRDDRASALVGAAGLLWVVMVLVPPDGSVPTTIIARFALAPTALLALAVIHAGRSAQSSVAGFAGLAAVLATVVGGAGHFRFAVLVIGLAVLAVALTGSRGAPAGDGRRPAAVLLQAGVGTGLTTVGALIAVPVGSERIVSTLHAAVLVLGSAGLCAVTSRSGGGAVDGLELDTPEGLGAALGRALDREPVVIALPKGDGTWLDAAGRRVEPLPDQRPWRAADGALLARLSDPGDLDQQQHRALDRLLAAAVHGARLRADLRERAAALDASRGRLLTAAADERARLATLIERGPLARLGRLDGLTPLVREDPVLATRRDAASTALGSVRRGLDPTAPGLELALRALADDTGASLRAESTWPTVDLLDPARARALWFVCAEALANAAKHSPGAPVEVSVRTTADAVEVRVRDRGPGGADPAGSGLAGLSERAASVGGWLRVRSDARGTEVSVGVPTTTADTGKPSATTARTLMSAAAPTETVAP